MVLVNGADESSDTPTQVTLTEDQRKHLDFIQAIVSRLSSSSATAKGWSLTIATIAFGFSATKFVPVVSGLGLVIVIFFGLLDSYYLREERLFRCLYADASRGQIEVYSMDKNVYSEKCTHWNVVRSWSVSGFYVPLLLVGVTALAWSIF